MGETRGAPLPLAPNGQGDWGAQRPKTTHRKASGSLSDVFVCQRQGEERTETEGDQWGVLIEQCVVLSSSVVHVILCRVDGRGHLHSVLQLLIG